MSSTTYRLQITKTDLISALETYLEVRDENSCICFEESSVKFKFKCGYCQAKELLELFNSKAVELPW